MSFPRANLVGQQFGGLTVVEFAGIRTFNSYKKGYYKITDWLLRCPLGHTEVRSIRSLKNQRGKCRCKACRRHEAV